MEIEKVVITKEQAEALEKNYAYTNQALLKLHAQSDHKWGDEWSGLNGMDFDTLAKALYIGYEVKKTPEEMVLDLYKYEDDSCNREATCAIKSTLDLLGIQIEGVNK